VLYHPTRSRQLLLQPAVDFSSRAFTSSSTTGIGHLSPVLGLKLLKSLLEHACIVGTELVAKVKDLHGLGELDPEALLDVVDLNLEGFLKKNCWEILKFPPTGHRSPLAAAKASVAVW